ncbi:hypothetical protein PAECIP111892_04895 [Paenibacillus auburnensis]|uniref:Tetratricopeptide repeat protein n=1 Tax=Paenibacillus auburnensis TaxID=2905649 RepID=A0ABM9CPQ9_9BACL|nr:tetratricopeptide repeat protein [Paenibacillus auburnensis]CAH1220680.1 hypothetical protein PAECIP111892_04895 [Paenibacillus auburnensis]
MIFQRSTLMDKLKRRQEDSFTGRESYFEELYNALDLQQQEDYKVLCFYGVGGAGKSSLRREMVHRLTQREDIAVGIVDFETKAHQQPENALIHLRKSIISRNKINFSFFDMVYALYMSKAYAHLPLKESVTPLLDEGDLLVELINTIEDVPGLGLVPKVYNLFRKSSSFIHKYMTKTKMDYFSQLSALDASELLAYLPDVFLEDLIAHQEKNRCQLVIFLDTYEALWEDKRMKGYQSVVDSWIREMIQGHPGLLWVITGRERLRWAEIDPSWESVCAQRPLDSLSEPESRAILVRSGVTDEDIQNAIIKQSYGHAYTIRLAVNLHNEILRTRTPVTQDFVDWRTPELLIERLLKYLTPYEIQTLELLAIARSWDEALFEAIVQAFQTGYPLYQRDELLRFSFIHHNELTNRWEMHALMRGSLRHHQSTRTIREGHRYLFEYYANLLSQHTFTGMLRDAYDWLDEAFFHGLQQVENGWRTPVSLSDWFRHEDAKFFNSGKWELTIPLFKQFISYLESLETTEAQTLRGILVYDLAYIYFKEGNYTDAETMFDISLDIHLTLYGEQNRFTAKSYYGLGTLYHNMGRMEEAEPLYCKALAIREQVLGEDHIGVAMSANNLATLYQDMKLHHLALPLYERAIRISLLPENYNPRKLADYKINLVYFHHDVEQYETALSICEEAIALRESSLTPLHRDMAQVFLYYGNVLLRRGELRLADEYYNKAVHILEELKHEFSGEMAKLHHNLGVYCYLAGRTDDSLKELDLAIEIKRAMYGEDHYRSRYSIQTKNQIMGLDPMPPRLHLDF